MKKQQGISMRFSGDGIRKCLVLALLVGGAGGVLAQAPQATSCRLVTLTGQAAAGSVWRAPIGQGWEVRLVPIASPYSGWDIVGAPVGDTAYPDALLLATPPWGSLTEREIGTTFGMRAQDAVAWMPRRFHFLTNADQLARARKAFPVAIGGGSAGVSASKALLSEIAHASAGELTITGAKLVAGVADPPNFAQQWASHLSRVPYQQLPAAGIPTPRGEIRSIDFRIRLWLPAGWTLPQGLKSEKTFCEP